MKCTRAVGDRFLSRFVIPKYRPLQCLKVEVWSSSENRKETNLKSLTAPDDEEMLTTIAV